MNIRSAHLTDLDQLAPLFDAYRQFYGQASDLAAAKTFLRDRLTQAQSAIFVAENANGLIGFVQLYPSFSSTRMMPIFILNDLYVAPTGRRQGTAAALLRAAAHHGRTHGALRLTLSTAQDNQAAQTLYAREGWTKDSQFQTFNLSL